MLRACFLFASLLVSACIYAQKSGTLKGHIVDSSAKQDLSFATVTIYKQKDSSIIVYKLSDPSGLFNIQRLPLNVESRVVITYAGYSVYRKNILLTDENAQLDLGVIHLTKDTLTLDELLLYSERPPVSVKNDTIEFNALAFKTLPAAMVEDLLKKLPGVFIDMDGNITVNGRSVSRILVDGKEFFGGDAQIATKNLPANLIDKVQVMDDKEQLEANPNILKSDLSQVINLRLKRSIKQGWFGKVYGGAGTNERYEAGGIVNVFRDTMQLSLLGYGNNINRAGFSVNDLNKLGGFGRQGNTGAGTSTEGGVNLGGVSFGGGGNGIQRSWGTGINYSHTPNKDLNMNVMYFYGNVLNDVLNKTNTQQFFNDTIQFTGSNSDDHTIMRTHTIGGLMRWKPDSFTTITFRPMVNIRNNDYDRDYASATSSNYDDEINSNEISYFRKSRDRSYNFSLSASRYNPKKRKGVFLHQSVNINDNNSRGINQSENIFYKTPSFNRTFNQEQIRKVDYLRSYTNLQYNNVINEKINYRLGTSINFFDEDERNDVYDIGTVLAKNDSLSWMLKRKGIKASLAPSISFRKGTKSNLEVGVDISLMDIKNDFGKGQVVNQDYIFVMPNLRYSYDRFSVGYQVYVNEPNAYNMRPVVDISNPLFLIYGNPELRPNIVHSFTTNFYKPVQKKFILYNQNLNFSIEQKSTVQERVLDDKGVQTTKPVNTNGIKRFNTNFSVSKEFHKKYFKVTLRPGMNMGIANTVLIFNGAKSDVMNFSVSPTMQWAISWSDRLEIGQRYTLNYNRTKYESDKYRDLEVTTHSASTDFVLRVPKNWVWESSIDYRYNPQVTPGISKSVIRWNAGINYLFLKDARGQLKLWIYDLLNQNTNAFRNTRENYFQDTEVNILRRYFLLTFTYNIRDFKPEKVGGRRSFFLF